MKDRSQSGLAKPRTNWLAIVGVWSLFGLWFGNQSFVDMHFRGMHHSYLRMLIWGWLIGIVWAPLTPPLLVIAKRFPFERSSLLRSIPIHLAVYALLSVLTTAAKELITLWMRPYAPLTLTGSFSELYASSYFGNAANTLAIYVAFLAIAHAQEYRRAARERELQAAQLEALLSRAQVLSLKMQLHPHFLFNTLNGIVALVREHENDSAVEMLIGLSKMLRYALDSSGRQEVPLSEEIEFLNLYLGVEQMRFPDRLKVKMSITPEVREALVPSLMLQPIVENAIRHGIAPRAALGTVSVSAMREGDSIILCVEDDGLGLSGEPSQSNGIGLANTRSRLAQLYESFEFLVRSRPEGGVGVRIVLPYRTETVSQG